MRREIVLLGDDVLRRKAKPVAAVDASTRRLVDDMVATMEQANGLGLAAPQVGIGKRVLVGHDEDDIIVLVNPQIVRRSGRVTASEGCLSLPGLYGLVPRARKVVVSGLDRSGRRITIEAEGLTARMLQHEIDHLNGVLFIDHAEELWFSVPVEPGEAVAPGELEDDEDEEDEGPRYRKVLTTIDEVQAYFAELRAERQTGTSR